LTFAKIKKVLLNGTIFSSILILTFAKNGKSPEKFCKSQNQNRKIGVLSYRTIIQSESTDVKESNE